MLEKVLSAVGKPFRRFPERYKSVSEYAGVIDREIQEVALLKLHGSLDWFDNRHYLELKASLKGQGLHRSSLYPVFDDPIRYGTRPLVDGLALPGDQLQHIHWIEKVAEYYDRDRGLRAPFILSPSHVKFVYAEPLMSLWRGLGRGGAGNLGISIIGFSLPERDDYIRIALYQLLSNYGAWWDSRMLGVLKDYARFVDFRSTHGQIEDYRTRYQFADAARSRFHYAGFGAEAIEFLFSQRREN